MIYDLIFNIKKMRHFILSDPLADASQLIVNLGVIFGSTAVNGCMASVTGTPEQDMEYHGGLDTLIYSPLFQVNFSFFKLIFFIKHDAFGK